MSKKKKRSKQTKRQPTPEQQAELDNYRKLVAARYLNASIAIAKGLRQLRGTNDFHFLISMRSFIEYTRRGIWFLAWATDDQLAVAEKTTFNRPGSPKLEDMDRMFNRAIGGEDKSPLMEKVTGMNPPEPFINALHALTHGNPISVRLLGPNMSTIFNFDGLMARAELEVGVFAILLYRQMVGEKIDDIWRMIATIVRDAAAVKTNVQIAAHQLKQSGRFDEAFQKLP